MNKKNSNSGIYLKYAGMGFQILATIGIFAWLGTILDRKLALKDPWMTILLVCVSFIGLLFWINADLSKNKS